MARSLFPGDSFFASGFRVLHESEMAPDYDHGATRVHLDGTACDCPCECRDNCEDWYAYLFPERGYQGPQAS
jgi:hypothetical protein